MKGDKRDFEDKGRMEEQIVPAVLGTGESVLGVRKLKLDMVLRDIESQGTSLLSCDTYESRFEEFIQMDTNYLDEIEFGLDSHSHSDSDSEVIITPHYQSDNDDDNNEDNNNRDYYDEHNNNPRANIIVSKKSRIMENTSPEVFKEHSRFGMGISLILSEKSRRIYENSKLKAILSIGVKISDLARTTGKTTSQEKTTLVQFGESFNYTHLPLYTYDPLTHAFSGACVTLAPLPNRRKVIQKAKAKKEESELRVLSQSDEARSTMNEDIMIQRLGQMLAKLKDLGGDPINMWEFLLDEDDTHGFDRTTQAIFLLSFLVMQKEAKLTLGSTLQDIMISHNTENLNSEGIEIPSIQQWCLTKWDMQEYLKIRKRLILKRKNRKPIFT